MVAAVAGRAMDGWALYEFLSAAPTNHADDLVVLANPANSAAVRTAETEFVQWYEALFYQPREGKGNAWMPERLEYGFACSAPKHGAEKQFVADEYYHGHLDWYNLDIDPAGVTLGDVEGAPPPAEVEATHTASFIPAPIQFDGMPHTRW